MKLKLLALAASAMMATTAHATITYTGEQTAGSENAYISLTTDGAIGALQQSDILGYDVAIVDNGGRVDLTGSNSSILLLYDPLVASSTTLFVDFDSDLAAESPSLIVFGAGAELFEGASVTDHDEASPPLIAIYGLGGFGYSLEPKGLTAIAIASGAPEPSAWALLTAGVGLIGMALRRRSRLAVA